MPLLVAQRNAHGVASLDHHHQLLAGVNPSVVHHASDSLIFSGRHHQQNLLFNSLSNNNNNNCKLKDLSEQGQSHYQQPLDFTMSKAYKSSHQLYRHFYGSSEMSDGASFEKPEGE